MFKKKECYLCGGKLINGRCSSCGLDNTKLDKKNYRLNESSFDRKKKMTYSKKRQNDTGETKNREKKNADRISAKRKSADGNSTDRADAAGWADGI